MSRARAHLFISGLVQGVFFRKNTKRQAKKRDLVGWVRNLDDGRVEAVFEGEKDNLEGMIEWCHQGPRLADIERVETEWEDPTDELESFRIRR
ncbi:MAG: acylphosphatase [Candidatus Aenigmatarchaeota archaeon]